MGLCLGALCTTKDLYKNVPDVWYDSMELLLQDYEFGRPLGAGVYAEVFEIINRKSQKRSAAKHFSKRTKIDEANQIRFAPESKDLAEEVAILKLLAGQDHCMRLDGVLETPAELYMLLELCEADLMGHVESHHRDVTEADAAEWSRCLLRAVAHCHRCKVMHRDIKPENILVTRERVVLGDFGSAVRFENHDTRFTQERGSSFWSSPETWSNDYDYRADCWSCGLVILVLVDGMLTSGMIRELHAMGLDAAFAHGVKYEGRQAHQLSRDLTHLLKGLLCRDPATRLSAEDALKLKWTKRQQDNVLPSARSNAGAYVSSQALERSVHAAIFALLDSTQRDALRAAVSTDHVLHTRESEEQKMVLPPSRFRRVQSETDTLPVVVVSAQALATALSDLGFHQVLSIVKNAPPAALLHVAFGANAHHVRRTHSTTDVIVGLDGSGHPLSSHSSSGETPAATKPLLDKMHSAAEMDATWPHRSASVPPLLAK